MNRYTLTYSGRNCGPSIFCQCFCLPLAALVTLCLSIFCVKYTGSSFLIPLPILSFILFFILLWLMERSKSWDIPDKVVTQLASSRDAVPILNYVRYGSVKCCCYTCSHKGIICYYRWYLCLRRTLFLTFWIVIPVAYMILIYYFYS